MKEQPTLIFIALLLMHLHPGRRTILWIKQWLHRWMSKHLMREREPALTNTQRVCRNEAQTKLMTNLFRFSYREIPAFLHFQYWYENNCTFALNLFSMHLQLERKLIYFYHYTFELCEMMNIAIPYRFISKIHTQKLQKTTVQS